MLTKLPTSRCKLSDATAIGTVAPQRSTARTAGSTNRNKVLVLSVFLLTSFFLQSLNSIAQNASQYSFSTVNNASLASDLNGNTISMSSGTTSLVTASKDDAASSSTDIGFNFTFFGNVYTAFTASSNGGIRLGGTIGTTVIGTSFPVTSQAILAPYLGDLRTSSSGKVHYKLFGTAPNRTAVIEFLNMGINFNSGGANGTFQVRLYEQTNTIEYVYGSMAVGSTSTTGSTTSSARNVIIGFSNTSGNNNEFTVNQSTYATSTTATEIVNTNSSTGNIAGLNSSANGSRRAFIFTPTLAYHAQFISMDLGSANWCAGETRDVTVTIKNIGTATWTNSSPEVNIGAKWNTNGGNWADYHIRVDAGDLAPGATQTYTFTITASNNAGAGYTTDLSAGTNNISFDIVKELDCWFGNNSGSCGPGNEEFTSSNQTILGNPTAVAGNAINTCSNSSAVNITSGASATNQASVLWSSSGTGTFANANSLTTATYTPSVADIAVGSVILTLTASPNSPCAANATSTKTLTINPAPTAVAGTAITTCSNSGAVNITAGASATNQTSIAWSTTNGTGSFANAGSLTTATYNPSAADITAGTRNLVLTVNGLAGCSSVTSNKSITITQAPTANAGPAINTCSNSGAVNITTGATSGNNSGITWSTPNGTGTFTNPNSLTTATYTPSLDDIAAGSVTITLTAAPNSPCASSVSANKTLTINTLPTANAGNAIITCSNSGAVNITSGAAATNQASITWTSNGTGSFASSTSLTNATYNPSAADISAGSRILTLTANGKAGCSNVTDTKTITITAAPIANAGSAISTCANSGAVNITTGATAGNSTGVTWSSNGTGTFTNENSLTDATYEPGAADIAAGSVTLTLTVTGNSPCNNATSSKTLTINPIPLTTGVTICQGTTSAALTSSSVCAQTNNLTDGPNLAGTAANSGSGTAWSNPGNVNANDNAYASVTGFGTAFSQTLVASDFGFAIPSDATIKGFQVSIARFRSGGTTGEIQDNSLKLVKGGTVVGTNKGATSTNWPTSEAVANYGTASDLWGTTWTPTDINANNFGVALLVDNTNTFSFFGTRTANVDYIQVTITYTKPGSIDWFTVSSGGTLIGSGASFDPVGVANSGLANTDNAGSTIYYAECSTIPGCRTPTSFNITEAPAAPVSGGNQSVCEDGNPNQTLTATATGGTITWFDAASNGSAVANPTQVGVGSNTYYAQAFDGTCNSLTRTAVTLTINAAPVAVTANQTVCSDGNPGQTLTATATGGTITWYDAATDGNVVSNPDQTGVGTSTYFAEAFDGTCTSLTRAQSVLTINPVPAAPISGGNQEACEDGNPNQSLTATATGGNISWFDLPTGGNSVSNPTLVGVGSVTYYAEASDGTCSSLSRTPVTLTIHAAPAAPLASNQSACEDGNPNQTLTATATGGTITWYDAATGGNVVESPVQVGPGSSIYYAEAFDGTCSSLTRTQVTLTIHAAPSAPVSGGNQEVCSDGTANQTLTATATGGSITWYDAATGGNVVENPVQVGPGSSIYYAEAFDGTCSSLTRTAVSLTINPLPATATVNITQPNCTTATGTITVTAPTGVGIEYSIDGNYQPSGVFSDLTPGTYTVNVRNQFGCVSLVAATAVVNPQPFVPGAPVVDGFVNVCPYIGANIPLTYTANVPGATSYNWTLPPNVNLVSGAGTNTIVITLAQGFDQQANKQLRVTAESECGTSAQTIFYLVSQYPNTPGSISGPVSVCSFIGSNNTATYTINKVQAATSYAWTLPANTTADHPNGSGVNDTVIVVTFNANYASGSITVAAVNGCGTSGSVRSIYLPRVSASTPSLINGPTNVCAYIAPNGTQATYTVRAVAGATSYTWTAPAGSIVSHVNAPGATDTAITVRYHENFVSGSITVKATNGCGTSAPRSLTITKLNPATPSVIDVIQTGFCPNREYSYTIIGMPANATSVQWTIPVAQGATLVSQTATSITVSYPANSVNGTVTVQSLNNCGSSPIRSTAVKLPACPPDEPGERFSQRGNTASVKDVASVVSENMEVKLFPNPTVSNVNLQVLTKSNETVSVRILDLQGRELKRLIVSPNQSTTFGSDLKAGSYIIETRQGSVLKTTKLIKF
ncbi:MAG: T9SS type A sorting domain-containing protein [Bacteroidetes bacterium]|nr:T9SS type A sorting domain-containing protein [Bacteroidota bacterium]